MEIAVVLTKDSLDGLLTRLDNDRDRAGEKYHALRLGLVRFFEWRGCTVPEDQADETIDRVARKIAQGEEVRDIYSYAAGVARFVFLEFVKERERQQVALLQVLPNPVSEEEVQLEEARVECVRKCLQALPPESSRLLMAYYQSETETTIQARKRLAQEMGISSHTLRMRLQRLRDKLEKCVAGHIHTGTGEMKSDE
jgi:RNA polymerase sigma factor (sigma-70 family)